VETATTCPACGTELVVPLDSPWGVHLSNMVDEAARGPTVKGKPRGDRKRRGDG